jgi:hypothetical protein
MSATKPEVGEFLWYYLTTYGICKVEILDNTQWKYHKARVISSSSGDGIGHIFDADTVELRGKYESIMRRTRTQIARGIEYNEQVVKSASNRIYFLRGQLAEIEKPILV